VEHPNHVVYLQHTLRGLYDTYPSDLPRRPGHDDPLVAQIDKHLDAVQERRAVGEVFEHFATLLDERGPDDPAMAFPGPLARRLVRALDRVALAPPAIRRHLAISQTVARRPGYFPPSVGVQAVHHPSDLEGLHGGNFEYFFTASRLDGAKRVDLLVNAMKHVPGAMRLKIAGTGPDLDNLRRLARDDPRVEFLGYVGTQQLVELYANARAVPFVPRDEDLGLITLEAMRSGKPVVTTNDAGGPTELVVDGVNGFVTEPTAEALGQALAQLAISRDVAQRMGHAAYKTAIAVTWDDVTSAILGTPRRPPDTTGARITRRGRNRRLVVLSTFPIHPREGGGQLRCFHLYKALAESYDLEAVSLAGPGDEQREIRLADGFVETVVPKSAEHEEAEAALGAEVRVPITDIAASLLITRTPAYLDAVREATAKADAAILAHPFQQPALAAVAPDLPMIYDAHNAEIMLKTAVLPDTDAGRRLLEVVRQVEGAATRHATLVGICSTEDEAALAHHYGLDPAKVLSVPNGVDARAIAFVDASARAAARDKWLRHYADLSGFTGFRSIAIFTGSWHLPNIDAGKHVIELASQLPDVLFLLVGRHGVEFARWALPPNVILVGVVSDATKQTLLACADVALNPMIRGSGTNLKIVEYFAAGIPVVSTSLGSRGLGVESETHLQIATLEEFSSAIRAVLDHPDDAAAMAERSRAVVEEQYDWTVLGRRLLAKVEEVVPRRPSLLYAGS
jgi:glycosyltransferase involved in cell wall biosynthesis